MPDSISIPPLPPANEAGGSDAGMEGHEGGAPRRHAAAGDSKGHPAGGPPGLQQEEGEDAVYDEEEVAAEPESSAQGCGLYTVRAGGRSRPNTCCICWEPWASCGAHRICCIPCGHVYGRFCLESWLIRCGGAAAKCPECGERFKHNHILNLYPTTEHLWDDSCHEQTTRHAAMEEEATQLVVKAAMEEIARKDNLIAKMEAKMARMTLVHEIRVTLMKIRETKKRITLLKEINLMLSVVIAVLLCAAVGLFMKM